MTNLLNQINYFMSHKCKVIVQVIKNGVKFQLLAVHLKTARKSSWLMYSWLQHHVAIPFLPGFLKKGY